jgi:hypothetical protein
MSAKCRWKRIFELHMPPRSKPTTRSWRRMARHNGERCQRATIRQGLSRSVDLGCGCAPASLSRHLFAKTKSVADLGSARVPKPGPGESTLSTTTKRAL